MSNSVSSAINTTQSKGTKTPKVPPVGNQQQQFEHGTRGMLDEARTMAENAAGQGQDLNPMIYQYLGLEPTYEDHTADIQGAQSEFDAANKQLSEAQQTISQLQAIPKGKRTPAQKQQMRQLKHHMPAFTAAQERSRDALGKLQTSPKTITGINRLDPSKIPADSPFSPQNPLNKGAAAQAQAFDRYATAGSSPTADASGRAMQIDPTLVHQWDQMEGQLRSQLTSRYGPDYENSSVGQLALSNFGRQKNEAFAQWNQRMLAQSQASAFGDAANLQSLAGNQINLWREPGHDSMNSAAQLSNLAGQRLTEQQAFNQRLGMHVGLQENVSTTSPIAANVAGAVGSALTTPGSGGGSSGWGTQATNWAGTQVGNLYNWATAPSTAGAEAAAASEAGANAATLDAGGAILV